MVTQTQFAEMVRKAETGEQFAELCKIEANGVKALRKLLAILTA